MRTVATISFFGDDSPGGPGPLLQAAGCGPDVIITNSPTGWRDMVRLDLTDDRYSAVVDLLVRHRVRWIENREEVYTEKEYERARLILIKLRTSEFLVFGGQRLGTRYAMDGACKRCGTGAKQTSPLMIDNDDVPKLKRIRVTLTYYDDCIVDERLAGELESLNAKGLSFRDVYSVTKEGRKTKLPWKQLCAARSMPPMSPLSESIYIEDPCSSCKRSGHSTHYDAPFRIAYPPKDIADIDDVMTTWEWYGEPDFDGSVATSQFSYPRLLLSPRVMRVIQAAAPTLFRFTPIRIVPDP